jgi:1-acyl-sn-glycerol-3-phosphate acyltransferase
VETRATPGQRVVFFMRYHALLVWGFFCTLAFLPPAVVLWGNTSLSFFYARTLSWVGLKILGSRVEITGHAHLLDRPAIFVVNHQSNYDIIFVGTVYPRHTVIIGKRELLRTPLFGIFFAATGNILIDRADHKHAVAGLDKAVDALRTRRVSIWVFPEGHRSRGTGLGPFKKGAFHMAIAAGVPVVPIMCSSVDRVINARAKIARGGLLRIHVLAPVPTVGLQPADAEKLRDDVHAICSDEWERLEGPGAR